MGWEGLFTEEIRIALSLPGGPGSEVRLRQKDPRVSGHSKVT